MVDTNNCQTDNSEIADSNKGVRHETCDPKLFLQHSNTCKWLTTREAAVYLRKFKKNGEPSTGAIRALVCKGQIAAKKFLGRLYFDKEELNRLIESSPTVGGCYGY